MLPLLAIVGAIMGVCGIVFWVCYRAYREIGDRPETARKVILLVVMVGAGLAMLLTGICGTIIMAA